MPKEVVYMATKFGGGGSIRNTIINFSGSNNLIVFSDDTVINNCIIKINGSNNVFIVGKESLLTGVSVTCDDDNNKITIGDNVDIHRNSVLYSAEGKKINIGSDCMISYDVEIRSSDAHSLMDCMGERTNSASDVEIGKNVWICQKTLVLKGTDIGEGSCVGAMSLLTGKKYGMKTLIAGVPAREVRQNISWKFDRI